MTDSFAPLSHFRLESAIAYQHPPRPPAAVTMDSPALDVMTDFAHVHPVTVTPEVGVEDALEHMRESGVRLLLVTDADDRVAGIVSSYDIQGERPVQLANERRVARSELRVGEIMTPWADMPVLNLLSVLHARVGHVVATLRALERRHLLVVEREGLDERAVEEAAERPGFDTDPWGKAAWQPPPERSGEQWVRGLFSATQIGRQLGVDVSEVLGPSHSLAEMVRDGIG